MIQQKKNQRATSITSFLIKLENWGTYYVLNIFVVDRSWLLTPTALYVHPVNLIMNSKMHFHIKHEGNIGFSKKKQSNYSQIVLGLILGPLKVISVRPNAHLTWEIAFWGGYFLLFFRHFSKWLVVTNRGSRWPWFKKKTCSWIEGSSFPEE